jgi:hypothetical protein
MYGFFGHRAARCAGACTGRHVFARLTVGLALFHVDRRERSACALRIHAHRRAVAVRVARSEPFTNEVQIVIAASRTARQTPISWSFQPLHSCVDELDVIPA